MQSRPPDLAGYRIETLLGRGGMGEVYLAWDERLERKVAVKRVRGDAGSDPHRRARFRREARAAARLSHPAVVQIYDIVTTDDGEHIVMEYVEGPHLREILDRRPLDLDLALRLAGEIADGLAEAHAQGLVHRDLKAENVVLTPAGHGKILDFGLACRLADDDSLTESGALVGTARAMAPEQATGEPVDQRGDLFAFGVLLYEMLAGRSPFRGANMLETLQRVVAVDPPSVRELRPEVPPALAELVARLLEKDPARRPPSIRLVAMELARCAAGSDDAVPGGGDAPAALPDPDAGIEDAPTVSAPRTPAAFGWRPAAGDTIPRRPNWRLEERLGEGGFGEVWRGRHQVTGERRVFKFCSDPERMRGLEREVALFRLLKEGLGERDDIARVLDWSFEAPPYFLESETTDGGDLATWAERRGGLAAVPLEIRLELVAELAEALAAAHSVGILHKDVKPANVLIVEDRQGRPHVRLSDFGIGLVIDAERLAAAGITAHGLTTSDASSGEGTWRYLAPELIEGRPPTIRSDVYALGVLLYQVVVGDLSRALASGWHREIDDELLCDDVARCVDGAPLRRPASAQEVADRLRALDRRRERRAAERRARQAAARAQRWRERARIVAAAVAVALLGISFFAFQTLRAKEREQRAREDSERRRQQAEKLIDFMVGDLRRKLAPIGKLDILGDVADQAMGYFAAVPRDDLSAEELRSHSQALHQIGQVRFSQGRFREAAEAFGQSLDLSQSLAARDPDNAEWQFELGQSHFWVGFLRWRQRDTATALEHFEAYRRISEALVAREPDNADAQLELAYSHSNVASILDERGDLDGASRALEASARTLEGLIVHSGDRQLPIELAHVYAKLGQILRRRGELTQALVRFQANLDLIERAVAEQPDNSELLRFLGFAHSHVANVQLTRGDLAAALDHFTTDLDIAAQLAEHEPDNLDWMAELALRHGLVAWAHRLDGDRTMARRHLEQETAIIERLIQQAPQHREWRYYRALNLWRRGELLLFDGRPEAALPMIEACHKTFDVLSHESQDGEYRLWLARAAWLLGEVHEALGNQTMALKAREEGSIVAESLLKEVRSPRHLALSARLLLALDRTQESSRLIAELETLGYREPSYLEVLDSRGLRASSAEHR